MNIFLVDDDQDDLENMSEAIARLGYTTELKTFAEPEHLLNSLQTYPTCIPDLIVFDHQTPGLKSPDAIQLLRQDKRFDKTAIAVYSSHLSTEKKMTLQTKGADITQAKGLLLDEITDHMKRFCEIAMKKGND